MSKLNEIEELVSKIKALSLSVTEENYYAELQKGYDFLTKLHDLGVEKESVYQELFQYHNCLEDNISRNCIADILDYVEADLRSWNS